MGFLEALSTVAQLRQEKVDLENALEQEEEFLTNKLQKQLFEVQAERE